MRQSYCCFLIIIAIGFQLVASDEEFPWRDDYTEWCLVPQSDNTGDLYECLTYIWNYMRINVELLSFEPVIVVYRNIIPLSKVEAFLNELKWKKEDEWKRKTREHGAYPEETTVLYGEGEGSTGTFATLSTMIPAVNFVVSEPWQVLRYKTGEDYPPRYDFLKNKRDKLTKHLGNRFATIMVLLKKAEAAGNTIFPTSRTTVELQEGDAVFWTNMNAEGMKSIGALHGDCLVKSGEKVTASLRIRAKDQLLIETSPYGGVYISGWLARPPRDIYRRMDEVFENRERGD